MRPDLRLTFPSDQSARLRFPGRLAGRPPAVVHLHRRPAGRRSTTTSTFAAGSRVALHLRACIEKFNGKVVRRMAAFCSGLAEAARRHEDNDGAAAAERAASAREQAREHVGVYRREQDRRAREECEWLEVERAQEGEEEEDAAISMRDIFGSDSEVWLSCNCPL